MILVTGTKRSGTSLWMQILVAGGFPHRGEAFPGPWEQSIREANPKGFYESAFRQGVFYATNPNPQTGQFLFPDAVTGHVVKVFIPGLVRTDYAYIGKVVATMRHWREYEASLARLYALEDAWLADNPHEGMTGEQTVAWVHEHRGNRPPVVEWFLENYDLVRDVATRRYAVNLCSYEALLADPEAMISRVFAWLGQGDVQGALQAVDRDLHRTRRAAEPASDPGVDAEALEVFEDFYDAVHRTQTLDRALLEKLNETYHRVEEQYGSLSRERGREEEPAPAE
jgi:hypothetical protein